MSLVSNDKPSVSLHTMDDRLDQIQDENIFRIIPVLCVRDFRNGPQGVSTDRFILVSELSRPEQTVSLGSEPRPSVSGHLLFSLARPQHSVILDTIPSVSIT